MYLCAWVPATAPAKPTSPPHETRTQTVALRSPRQPKLTKQRRCTHGVNITGKHSLPNSPLQETRSQAAVLRSLQQPHLQRIVVFMLRAKQNKYHQVPDSAASSWINAPFKAK